jgi:hypothetical protein
VKCLHVIALKQSKLARTGRSELVDQIISIVFLEVEQAACIIMIALLRFWTDKKASIDWRPSDDAYKKYTSARRGSCAACNFAYQKESIVAKLSATGCD